MIDKLIGYLFRFIAFAMFTAMTFVWLLLTVFIIAFVLKILGLV